MTVVALAGGIGAAKLCEGLYAELGKDLNIITNIGDDDVFFGLNVSSDLDIITYTLAGIVDQDRRWGLATETFSCMERLGIFYPESWFNLGDRDLATHIFRTDLLRQGKTLAEVTAIITQKLGLRCNILPVSNDPVHTKIHTSHGVLHFEEYFVKNKASVPLTKIEYRGASEAIPAPGVLEAIKNAERIIICPSNPILSIAPILAIPSIRQLITKFRQKVIAVTPIIQGAAVKGPTARNLRELGYDNSAFGVVDYYKPNLFSHFVIDQRDKDLLNHFTSNRFSPPITFSSFDTLMVDITKKIELARRILSLPL
ncbi:MAG: LPPG:FO 2-phospho-L-lactate transferase [Promethearchaeota archaeon CR_4]|nr:MAG: LPPG:FO 2-phospho-L-lactate transferase [Candidatus Lokiarchaeota archaeon CR_4]